MADTEGDATLTQKAGFPSSRPNLTKSETIKRLYETYYSQKRRELEPWIVAYAAILRDVRNASVQELSTPEFQRRLWVDNPVSSTGASAISMTDVVESRELGEWVARAAKTALPPRGPERLRVLEEIYTGLSEGVSAAKMRVTPGGAKMPWLRILRVMATLFPEDYSSVTSERHLRAVGKAMFGGQRGSPKTSRASAMTLLNARIFDCLTEVLGPTDGTPEQLALRGAFVWFLWETIGGGDTPPPDESEADIDSDKILIFPPAARRLKGISPIPDPVGTILKTVDFVSKNQPTRAAVIEFILGEYPTIQRNSASQYLSCMWKTFGMLQLDGEIVELTPTGRAFLDSEDLDILIHPWLTKSIGPDLVLWRLGEQGPTSRTDLIQALQNHYRRWTTTFMPNSILAWGRSFDLWAADSAGKYALTQRGRRWTARLDSAPLPVADEDDVDPDPFTAPSLQELLNVFRRGALVLQDEAVIRLHAALHANASKHFVLLSGLSGTGKTQMAIAYANAYHRVQPESPNPRLCLISVQPDWTDATGLLGYVNPLGAEASYVRTECLKFLLLTHEHPSVPHFLCLDEMNLARVEYYFAPFLSAMETGGRLVFHHEDEALDDVPPSIPWPSNLYILGTVNMDETTHAFSDKVLDRAFTIEFWDVDLDQYAQRFALNSQHAGYPPDLLQEIIRTLKEAASILLAVHQHFGYRTAEEVLGFMRACEGNLPRVAALDQAIFMKVLPKIRGQDAEPMRRALGDLGQWAEKRGFAATANKVRGMATELRDTGTTRFWR